jgi:hypothetical protein
VLEHLGDKKRYLFPGCCLARDEDGVAVSPFTVKMLEDLDPSTDGSWLQRCNHLAGKDGLEAGAT